MNTLPESHRRPLFPRGPGLGLRVLALLGLALSLIVYDARSESLDGTRDVLTTVTDPLIWLVQLPDQILDAITSFSTRATLEQENATLREQQLLQAARLQRLEALEAENRRLRELLASAARIDDTVVIAEIVALNQDPYRNQITLNKGARNGVYRGQALVDAHGVMGQITEVSSRRARALLITDPDHGIPVEVTRTGMQTIAIGAGDQGLRLPFLASNADIQVGDELVSSALGDRFPTGYAVGSVYEVKHVAGEHFMEALATPAARINQGRQALLVWNPEHDTHADDRDDDADADTSTPVAPDTSRPTPVTAAP